MGQSDCLHEWIAKVSRWWRRKYIWKKKHSSIAAGEESVAANTIMREFIYLSIVRKNTMCHCREIFYRKITASYAWKLLKKLHWLRHQFQSPHTMNFTQIPITPLSLLHDHMQTLFIRSCFYFNTPRRVTLISKNCEPDKTARDILVRPHLAVWPFARLSMCPCTRECVCCAFVKCQCENITSSATATNSGR